MNKINFAQFRRQARLALDRAEDRLRRVDTLSGAWTAIPKPGEPGYDSWLKTGVHQYLPSEVSRHQDSRPNLPVAWMALPWFIDRLCPSDVFYDIGCGNGRVLCYVARQRIRACIGVELGKDFATKALANAMTMRGRLSPVEVQVGDAAEVNYDRGTVFYLANPFGADTLRAVLEKIRETLEANPRRVRFIYVSPAHRDVMNSTGWLKHAGHRKFPLSQQEAEYWTN